MGQLNTDSKLTELELYHEKLKYDCFSSYKKKKKDSHQKEIIIIKWTFNTIKYHKWQLYNPSNDFI